MLHKIVPHKTRNEINPVQISKLYTLHICPMPLVEPRKVINLNAESGLAIIAEATSGTEVQEVVVTNRLVVAGTPLVLPLAVVTKVLRIPRSSDGEPVKLERRGVRLGVPISDLELPSTLNGVRLEEELGGAVVVVEDIALLSGLLRDTGEHSGVLTLDRREPEGDVGGRGGRVHLGRHWSGLRGVAEVRAPNALELKGLDVAADGKSGSGGRGVSNGEEGSELHYDGCMEEVDR